MRLDEWLFEKKYFESVEAAQKAVLRGLVRKKASGELLDKPGWQVPKILEIAVEEPDPFVGRGGHKLEGLLKTLNWDLRNAVVLDVGASTGGFTDCVLQRGARRVYAVDVGTHQLHEKLRSDERVEVFENTDIRNLPLSRLQPLPRLILVDVAFISLKSVVPFLHEVFPGVPMILLFKPQFEVGRFVPKKRGIAPAAEARKSLEEMLLFLRGLGLNPTVVKESALLGGKGNQETFVVTMPEVPRHIFRTYDIRGHADNDLSDDTMEKIGRVFGRRLVAKVGEGARLGLGRDARISSPRIHAALARGLSSQGVKVIDMGMIATPMAYYSHFNFDLEAIVMVTASHNPKEDNGMKMMVTKNTLFGEEISSLYDDVQREIIVSSSSDATISDSIHDALRKNYIQFLHREFKFKKKFKMVIDCGNGMAGSIARDVFAPYAEALEILYEKVDCTFPHHEADPTIPANIRELRERVRETGADVGFAFDGDADRLGVVSSSGRILWGDEIVMLLSELVLSRQPGATVIGEVKCSEKLFRMIEGKGGKPLMYKTGHSLIKKKMKEVSAPLAGEMSGHLFFADRYFGFDDATYGALRVLEVMDQLVPDLDVWIDTYPSYAVTPEIRVACREDEKQGLVEKVKAYFSKHADAKLYLIDGVRVGFSDASWALVRASNTQAVLVVRIEATSQERLEEIQGMVSEALGREVDV